MCLTIRNNNMFRFLENANWLKQLRVHLQRLVVRLILCKSSNRGSSGFCCHEGEKKMDAGQQTRAVCYTHYSAL